MGVALAEGEGLGVGVAVAEGEGLGTGVEVGVGVDVRSGAGVNVNVGKGTGVGVGLGEDASSDGWLLSGTVVGVNDKLSGDPALINQDPMGEGWMFQIELSDAAELDGLMDEAAYAEFAK